MVNWSYYFTLVYYLTITDLKAESKKYYISYLWWLVEPVTQMFIYYFVFKVLLHRGQPGFLSFLLVGLMVWRWWAISLGQSMMSIFNNKSLLKRVVIPKTIFPTVSVLSHTIKFLFVFFVLLIFLWLNHHPINIKYLALIPLLAGQFLLILGTSYLLSAIIPLMIDLKLLVNSGLFMLFFLSGIFFPGNTISGKYKSLFYLNPLAGMVESYRTILLDQNWPVFSHVFSIFVWGSCFLVLGLIILRKLDPIYPKVLH